MVDCQICQAVYAPAEEYRYLSQAPQVALESALMSMCHFCFRCRRPACPQCWDNIHGVCGECSQEANLPFRAQAIPLRGVLFPTARQAQLRHKHRENIRLICIIPGRFQRLAPIEEAETRPYLNKTHTRDHFIKQETPPSALPPLSAQLIAPYPIQPQTTNKQTNSHNVPQKTPLPNRATAELEDIATQPEQLQTGKQERQTNLTRSGKQESTRQITMNERPLPQNVQKRKSTRGSTQKKRLQTIGQRIESFCTVLLSTVLVCILILIVLAGISPDANTTILQIFHMNIRAELLALWRLLFP
jgi:hypothetical protein